MWNNVDSCYYKNMTGKNLSTGQCFFIIIATILAVISPCTPVISDKRLCYDPDCSVVIASAKTLSQYFSNDPHILSFNVNEDVEIFSKGAGSRSDLWGVQIAGKRGYVPSRLLLEKKTYQKELKHEVPILEYNQQFSVPPPDILKNKKNKATADEPVIADSVIKTDVEPPAELSIENSHPTADQISPSFEVIDGTTINLSLKEETKSDDVYVQETIQGSLPMIEQPILTVHPNLGPSEIILNKDVPIETAVLSSEKSDQLPVGSEIENITDEEVATESPDLANSLQPPNNDQVIPPEVESTTINVESLIPQEIEQSPPENITQDQQIPPPEELKVENLNINSSDINLPVDSANETSETVSENSVANETSEAVSKNSVANETSETVSKNTLPELRNETKIVEEPLQTVQPDEPPIAVEKIEEEIITNTSATSDEAPIDTLSNVIGKVTSLFDGLSLTTEAVTEAPTTEESVQEPNIQSTVVPEPIANTILIDTSEGTIDIPDNIVNETSSDPANSPEKINSEVNANSTIKNEPTNIPETNEFLDVSSDTITATPLDVNEFPTSRSLLNVNDDVLNDNETKIVDDASGISSAEENVSTVADEIIIPDEPAPILSDIPEKLADHHNIHSQINELEDTIAVNEEQETAPVDSCHIDNTCNNYDNVEMLPEQMENAGETIVDDAADDDEDDAATFYTFENSQHYWETLSYVALTAFTTLFFSLGYYYMENTRRDGQLIAKINKLEKELLISNKECTVLDETLKSTKTKLNSIEDQSFGSNEMVLSLKTDLEIACKAKLELEDQVVALEKDVESATEAGLELERMLREILASNNAENPLAKSVEDLQSRLNTQQSANESLTNALRLKTQESEFDKAENEVLSSELSVTSSKCEQLEVEVTRLSEELKLASEAKDKIEKSLSKKVEQLESQIKNISAEKITLRKQLKGKEMELQDLLEVLKQANTSNIDFEKLSDVSRVKAEASQLLEEKEELQIKLGELEGAHHLLEEHMKIINEEMKSLSRQCEIAEKEKQDAETRLQVLSKFFKEKEEERQKEESIWQQRQGEVSTASERLQTLNNEVQSYKQQIETLKREILDQEREYKNQISNLESKSHDQWVVARQSERRLEEAKAEAGQLRNRLTLIEKNYSDNESDVKTHRMDTNGETARSPQLFIGAEASSSPIMFTGSSSMPPPYLYGPPLPPFLPPPLHSSANISVGYDVGQRPPPLGGRLSSPPPMSVSQNPPPPPTSSIHQSSGGRFERSGSSPPSPPISPSMLPSYGHYRSHPHPPPPLPFPNERIHPPPPVPLPSLLPGHLPNPLWGEEKMSLRNNGSFHRFHRDQQPRDYKGSLVSSEESLDKTHHSGKI